jgi:hypothetical protein
MKENYKSHNHSLSKLYVRVCYIINRSTVKLPIVQDYQRPIITKDEACICIVLNSLIPSIQCDQHNQFQTENDHISIVLF